MVNISLPRSEWAHFCAAVWKLVQQIPPGKVASYGQIALFIPTPPGTAEQTYLAFRSRWVGQAMAECPPGVPWQRVINAQGMVSPRRGADEQRSLLEGEGVVFNLRARVDLRQFGWSGPTAEWLAENGYQSPPGETHQESLF